MARISLKNIFSKKEGTFSLLPALLESIKASVWIEDDSGKLLSGIQNENAEGGYPILLDEELMGWVKGDTKGKVIADLLVYLLQKEKEKKKLGSEVLNLYQEINLIFNFSEKLAQTIDAPAICAITLNEASHVINSEDGIVILFDETTNQLEVMASVGELFFDPKKINSNQSKLFHILSSGMSGIITDTTELFEAGIILPGIKSVIYSALKVKHRLMGAIVLATAEDVQYTAGDLKLLTTLALQSSGAIESALLYEKNIQEAKEREEAMRRVYDVTGKFVPYEFIASLGHNVITDIRLGDQVEKIVTVLFSDIRDYTTFSEQMSLEENFRFVSSFNSLMGPIIKKNNGFVNQYLGDSIMAIFPGNAADALNAAIGMRLALEQLNAERRAMDQPPIYIGLGMHTGPLIMGIIGDDHRMDAATIADTVNTASRIESLTKYYKTDIIISDASLQQIAEPRNYKLRHLGLVQLKGKHEAIRIHECFSSNTKEQIEQKQSTLQLFHQGMEHYINRSFDKARDAFQEVMEVSPFDRTAAFFHNKTEQLVSTVSKENWIGIVEMSEK
jgi:class 3 adenylate cyclase